MLHLFPFEANVPAQFAVLDDRSAAELLDAVRQAILLEANARPDGGLAGPSRASWKMRAKDAFDGLLSELTARGDLVRAIVKADGGAGPTVERLRNLLLLAPGESVAAIERELDEGCLPEEDWPASPRPCRRAGKNTMTKLGTAFADASL